jgi:hypothetical protein
MISRLLHPMTLLLLIVLILWCVIVYQLGGFIAIVGWMAAAVVVCWLWGRAL